MKYLNFPVTAYKLCTVVIIGIVVFSSCDNNFEDKKEIKNQNNVIEKLELVDGTIRIENITTLRSIFNSYKNNNEGQNNFNKEIRYVQNRGFKPLTPIFDENENEKIEKFLINKKQKIQNRNLEFGITSKFLSDDDEDEIDFDDELISDPILAALLNEDREIYVADSLYKYTETGLYFCHKRDKQKLYDYLQNTTPLEKLETAKKGSSFNSVMSKLSSTFANELVEVTNGIMQFIPNPIDDFGGGMYVSLPNMPNLNPSFIVENPRLIKQSLPMAFSKKNSWFEKIFGETEVDTEHYGDGKRLKVKFWNHNYLLFSSIGCSARFQKRVKILGVSGWQKAYAQQIELGINRAEFDYNFNVPMYDIARYNYESFFIEYNGVKYDRYGKQIFNFPIDKPSFLFSEASSQKVLTIFIFDNKYEIDYKWSDLKNIAVDAALKALVDNMPYSATKNELNKIIQDGDSKYDIIRAIPFNSAVTLTTMGVKWTNNDDNAITHYFDFNFLFTWTNEYSGVGDFLKGLKGGTSYNNFKVDVYGAALHNGQWKGRRIILEKKK